MAKKPTRKEHCRNLHTFQCWGASRKFGEYHNLVGHQECINKGPGSWYRLLEADAVAESKKCGECKRLKRLRMAKEKRMKRLGFKPAGWLLVDQPHPIFNKV